jgi:chemotaxis regulatin CheY-phosphate phosphatase CheZ
MGKTLKTGSTDVLARERALLIGFIVKARQEIAELRPVDFKDKDLPDASRQIDAVVKMTDEAAETIMATAEEIMGCEDIGEEVLAKTVRPACMRIIEACSFQDITGQRISKVLKTLLTIEEHFARLQAAWDVSDDELKKANSNGAGEGKTDDELLNGPALEGEGIDQNQVDALFDD